MHGKNIPLQLTYGVDSTAKYIDQVVVESNLAVLKNTQDMTKRDRDKKVYITIPLCPKYEKSLIPLLLSSLLQGRYLQDD